MSVGVSLKDQLFNAQSLGQLASEFAQGVPGFDAQVFLDHVLPGLASRELMARLDWIATCIAAQLASDFPHMADQLLAAMSAPLDPAKCDGDFGQFIHAVPGVLAVRHGMQADHLDCALDLLEQATKRFSMEFYIRPFLDAFPDHVMARLHDWAGHENYHIRRLVSEGTRPKLPWAKKIRLNASKALPLLDRLYADPTRYVTRSVANHLNDIAKSHPDTVIDRLKIWRKQGCQDPKEMDWITKHALRSLIKQGHPRAMAMLGFDPKADIVVDRFDITPPRAQIGQSVKIAVTLSAPAPVPVVVDYIIWFKRPNGQENAKVHKMKQAKLTRGQAVQITKTHIFKADATTYTLVPGLHRVAVQVNGRIVAERMIDLRAV
jgi:3-methyladenine DNA glycosylase AlkC